MIDTQQKRMSAIMVGLPFRAVLPPAELTVSQADRQTVAFSYSGILAEAFVTPTFRNIVGIQLSAPNIVGRTPV